MCANDSQGSTQGFIWSDLSGGGVEPIRKFKTDGTGSKHVRMSDPYLPGPRVFQPMRGEAGFRVHHDACQPKCREDEHICQDKVFRSYGEWYQAHQRPPPQELPDPVRHEKVATSYWPYGTAITTLAGSLDQAPQAGHQYILDNRPLQFVVPHGPQDRRVTRRAGRASIRTAGSAAGSEEGSMSPSRSSPTLLLAGNAAASGSPKAAASACQPEWLPAAARVPVPHLGSYEEGCRARQNIHQLAGNAYASGAGYAAAGVPQAPSRPQPLLGSHAESKLKR